MISTIVILSVLVVCAISEVPPQNPVIGIYTQTLSNTSTDKSSYIAASYVKWIEMSGAQVVPIYSFADTAEVLALLGKINGVVFPGMM
jgi:gamma-glutamyl-gamma-aminobutyrate hydrolase PuuD